MDWTRGRFTWQGRIAPLREARRRAIARIGWPAILLAAAVVLAAAAALVRESSSLTALERPVRHHDIASKQVQDPPAMPLILNFDLRP